MKTSVIMDQSVNKNLLLEQGKFGLLCLEHTARWLPITVFAVPVLIPRMRVLDWNIGEIKDIVIKTRKTLTLAQNFHPNRNVDRLYMQKSFGEIGLRKVQRS